MFRTLALASALAAVVSAPAFAADSTYGDSVAVIPTLKLGVGSYDTFQSDDGGVAMKAELHSTMRPFNSWNSLHPFIGVDTTNHGGYYANAGIAGDLAMTPNWVITPSLAAGFYEEGGAKDLGTNFALRPGIELAYRFRDDQKIGLELTSTTGVTSDSESVEAITLNYHIPFGVAGTFKTKPITSRGLDRPRL